MKAMCKALILLLPLLVLGGSVGGRGIGIAGEDKTAFKEATAPRDVVLPISSRLEGPSYKYLGYKKGCGCHISQIDSWKKTSHARTFDSLRPDVKVEEKKKAGLDPAKDYTQDKNCLPCHTTGYLKKGGYSIEIAEKEAAKYLGGVTCEMCHGAGELYRREHRKAGDRFKKTNRPRPRENLERLGQYVSTERIMEACNTCHLNYEGSGWIATKEPYSPFTPKIDPKYRFDFDRAVKEREAVHDYFKLRGAFTGDPVFKYRDEFQKTAKEVGAGR